MTQYQGVWSLQSAAQLQSTQRWVTDPLFDYTTLLLQADDAANGAQNNTFLDSSGNALPIARLPASGPNAPTQGSFTPFSSQPGAWGNFFNGSSDFLNIGSGYPASLDLGSGNFTIEGWVYLQATTKQLLLGNLNDSNGTCTFFVILNNTSASARYEIKFGSSAFNLGAGTLPTNQWVHVCVMRSGTSIFLFENGAQVGATQTYSGSIPVVANQMRVGGAIAGQYPLSGYASNLRMVIGSTVYSTSGFTVPTTPLTAITNTALLTCQSNRFFDSSANAISITTSGTPSVQPFSPFAPQFQWTPSIIGGSGYFDGSTDNIQTSIGSPNLSIGTGDFTFECWVYLLGASGDPGIMQLAGSPFGTNQPTYSNSVGVIATTGAGFWALINNGSYTNGSISRVLNTWTHLAICRSGTTHRLFVNGVQAVSVSDSSNYTTQYFAAGCAYGTNFPSNSYISNIRFVKGTAVYTGAFTPPTRPLSASGADSASAYPSTTNVNTSFAASATSLFLNFTNAGIYDGTMKNNLETVGNAQISTAVVKYGSGSLYFDGTGDWLSIPSSPNLYLSSGPFTLEAWVYPLTNTAGVIMGRRAAVAAQGFFLGYGNVTSQKFSFYCGDSNTSGWEVTLTSTNTFAPNQWYYVSVTRDSSNLFTLRVNGVSEATATNSVVIADDTSPLSVGGFILSNESFNGYIDDLRVTRGIARYTQNFIPPSVALPRQ